MREFKLAICAVSLLVLKSSYGSNIETNLEQCENINSGPWSSILEEWATGFNHRQMRIMRLPPTHNYYIVDRKDSNTYNEWHKMTPPPSPGKIVNRPPNPYLQKEKPRPHDPQKLQDKISEQPQPPQPQRKEVSETDLYLLGAIEKLVYRVDLMEKRMRKLEENMYFVMAGTNKNPDPCPEKFTRAGKLCYHFGSEEKYDWKTSSLVCKKLKGHLIEMESLEENKDVLAYIQANKDLRGKDFWTGGLNPGLLWIWSNSGRPVSDGKNNTQNTDSTITNIIHGEGRCLKFSYNPALRGYAYFGNDCTIRQHFICELPEQSLSNEIERVARQLRTIQNKATVFRKKR